MELKEFIKEVLTDIIDGVVETQTYAAQKGAIIAPTMKKRFSEENYKTKFSQTGGAIDHNVGPSDIEFKVILTDKVGNGKAKGIGVSFGKYGAGASKENQTTTESCTQLTFTVPIYYPVQK